MLGKSEDFGTAAPERRASMRICDLDEIKICVDRQYENCHGYSGSKKAIYREAILAVKSILHSVKPIDAVPVVRCRDCKHRGTDYCIFHIKGEPADEELLRKQDNDFCSYEIGRAHV